MKQEETDKDECDSFPGQQTKRKTITEALKIYSECFLGTLPLPSRLPEHSCAQTKANPPL